jgi:threonine dehydratase
MGAAALAALLAHRDRFVGKTVGLVISGGNIDPFALISILQRGLRRSGHLARLIVELPDLPGALVRAAQCMTEREASIVEVHHQRTFTTLPLRAVVVEFLLQTRGRAHMDEISESLRTAGLAGRWIDASASP